MHTSFSLPQAYLLFLFFFIEFAYSQSSSCPPPNVGNKIGQDCSAVICNAPPTSTSSSITVLATPVTGSNLKKRAAWDPIDQNNVTWPPEGYAYMVSPFYKPAAVLRECSGSIVTSFDTIHANLNGRGQTWVSQRNLSEPCCTNSTPIRILSGGGSVSTVIQADLYFPGGVLHIVDK
jgi:hypothetical protein